MRYWAIDAGGSGTTALLDDGTRLRAGSVNPASVGTSAAEAELLNLFEWIAEALPRGTPAQAQSGSGDPRSGAGGAGGPPLGLTTGSASDDEVAGWLATATLDADADPAELDRMADLAARTGLPGTLVISRDVLPLLLAPPLSGRGVAVVCGTGTGLLASDGHCAPLSIGGCEYLGSDEGSAYAIGLDGLRAAVRGADGRAAPTALTQVLPPAGQSVTDLARSLAGLAFPKAAVAALAPVVCRCWLDGDRVAGDVVRQALDELALGVRAVRDATGLDGEWSALLSGGVFRGCPEFAAALSELLARRFGIEPPVVIEDPTAAVLSALREAERGDEALEGRWIWTRSLSGGSTSHGNTDHQARDLRLMSPFAATSDSALPKFVSGPIQPGLCLAAFGPEGLDGALASASRAGFGVIDLPTDSTLGLLDPARLADRRYHDMIRGRVVDAGLTIGCVSNSRDTQLILGPHGPHTDPVHAGDAQAKREHGLRAALDTVRFAAGVGCRRARLMLGCPDLARWLSWWGSDVSWQDNVTAWCEAARPVLQLAGDLGVEILVEPHPKQVVYDPGSVRALLAAAEEAPAPVRLCLDPANMAATGHDPVEAVRGWGDALAAVHAKDLQRWSRPGEPRGAGWSRYGPGPAIRFRSLGAGDLPWPGIVSALLDEDFRGVLYVEHEDALLPREQGVEASLAMLHRLLPAQVAQGRTW